MRLYHDFGADLRIKIKESMNRYTVQVPHNFYSREVSVSRRRPPTTPVSRQNRRVPLCNDGISPQDTSFPGTSPGMSLDTLPNVGMRIDNDIDDYGSDSELSSNNSGQFNSTLNDFVPRYIIYYIARAS